MLKWEGVKDTWQRIVQEPDELVSRSTSDISADMCNCGAQLRGSFRILAQALYPTPVEAIAFAGAHPDIVREIRKRHTDLYFQHWRVVRTGLRRMLQAELTASINAGEWMNWVNTRWKGLRLSYYLASLKTTGLLYSLGMRANPRGALQKLSHLFAIADSGCHIPQG